MLLDEISQKLHQHGHEVRMLLHPGNPVITGMHVEERYLSQHSSDPSLSIGHYNYFTCFLFRVFLHRTYRQLPNQPLVSGREIHQGI